MFRIMQSMNDTKATVKHEVRHEGGGHFSPANIHHNGRQHHKILTATLSCHY